MNEVDKVNIDTTETVVTESPGVSLWLAIAMSFLASILMVLFYHIMVVRDRPSLTIGLVDLQTIMREIEDEARKSMVDNENATDEQRSKAASIYETRMKTLQTAINEVGKNCQCTLMIKAAFLNNENNKDHGIKEYTSDVRKMIGLGDK